MATPPIYDQMYLKNLATASLGNPVGVTKPSFLFLFLQWDKNLWRSQVLREPIL